MPEKEKQNETYDGKLPAAPTGNASNPSAEAGTGIGAGENQLLNAKAEQYLREGASIEDMPDDEDWQEADKTLRDEAKDDQQKP